MEALNLLSCQNCNRKCAEFFLFPCMHNFCSNCTELMKNGAETTCLICSNSCHHNEVKKNIFLEKLVSFESQIKKRKIEMIVCELCDSDGSINQADKYCVDCSQYICSKCLKIHIKSNLCKDHKIINTNKVENLAVKWPEHYCDRHKQNFNVYCQTCDDIMCGDCYSMDILHSNHNIADNFNEIISKVNSDLKEKIIEIDNIINYQNSQLKENIILENNLFQNFNAVRKEIETYGEELKNKIDNLTKVNVDKIITLKNDFICSYKAKFEEITEYISSLKKLKLHFQNLINKGSSVDLINSKNEINKNNWIEVNKPMVIKQFKLSFPKPFIDSFISNELSRSFKLLQIKDLSIKLNSSIRSACVFKHNIYTIDKIDQCINIYDIETGKYQSSLEIKKFLGKNINRCVYISNTKNDLFFYCYISNDRTYIFKLNIDNKTFVELKTLKSCCKITSTFQQTILAKTSRNELIELSTDGDELKRVTISKAVVSSYNLSSTAHHLKDGRYLIKNNDSESVRFNLLDSKGNLITSLTQPTNKYEVSTCTDGEKFIFVLYVNIGEIQILSTELVPLHQFYSPDVENIYYDHVNDKLLLTKKDEILYFTYHLGMVVSI